MPLVDTVRKNLCGCFPETEKSEFGERETEVEMSSFRSGNKVKHNFSKDQTIDAIPEGRDSEMDDDLEIGTSFTKSPIHNSLSNFDRIFVNLASFGKGDPGLDEEVWKSISTTSRINSRSVWGDTILLRVCQHKCKHLLPMLLRRGADYNALAEDSTSCLHFVCRPTHASSAMANDLLAAGANPNVRTVSTGVTPLHYAAQSNELELCRLLLLHGADASIKDKDGYFPTKYAMDAGFVKLAEVLDAALISAVEAAGGPARKQIEEGSDDAIPNHTSANNLASSTRTSGSTATATDSDTAAVDVRARVGAGAVENSIAQATAVASSNTLEQQHRMREMEKARKKAEREKEEMANATEEHARVMRMVDQGATTTKTVGNTARTVESRKKKKGDKEPAQSEDEL